MGSISVATLVSFQTFLISKAPGRICSVVCCYTCPEFNQERRAFESIVEYDFLD